LERIWIVWNIWLCKLQVNIYRATGDSKLCAVWSLIFSFFW